MSDSRYVRDFNRFIGHLQAEYRREPDYRTPDQQAWANDMALPAEPRNMNRPTLCPRCNRMHLKAWGGGGGTMCPWGLKWPT